MFLPDREALQDKQEFKVFQHENAQTVSSASFMLLHFWLDVQLNHLMFVLFAVECS